MVQAQRNAAYFATQVDNTELERLVATAHSRAPHVWDGLRRIGLGPGDKAIDVGCGPVGALLVLAECVGPTGTVVGVDMDAPSLQRAGALLEQQGYADVQLVEANVNMMSPTAVCPPGPFDVAVCMQFLNNQREPVETLRRIADFVRPGGHLLVHTNLYFDPDPGSEPALPASSVVRHWLGEVMRWRGAAPDVAKDYRRLCQAAGLIEVSQRGFFLVGSGSVVPQLRSNQALQRGLRTQLIEQDIASAEDVDTVLQQLQAAEEWEFQVYFRGMQVELIAQVP